MGSADHPAVSPTPSLGPTGSLEAGFSAPDLKILFDAAPFGVFLITIDGCYLFVNRAFVGLLGYDSAEEMLTLNANRDVIVDPGDCQELFARAAGGAASGADVRLHRRDGSVIAASLHVHGIGDPYGRGSSFIVFATDVTSHRDAEQRLRESRDELARSNSQLRVVYEQVPAIVWSTDRELRFTSSQGKGLAILGLAPDQVVGLTVSEYLGDHEDLPRHRRALEGEPQRYETSFGRYRFTCSLDPLRDADGTIVGTIGTAMEITTHRQLEERLREAQKMEGLALLAGGVAHDFNNLLVGILGNAELALHEVPEEGRLRTFLERLRLSAQRASESDEPAAGLFRTRSVRRRADSPERAHRRDGRTPANQHFEERLARHRPGPGTPYRQRRRRPDPAGRDESDHQRFGRHRRAWRHGLPPDPASRVGTGGKRRAGCVCRHRSHRRRLRHGR